MGIGGIGLSAIARVMLERGNSVSGSDLHPNALTEALGENGVHVDAGHSAENVRGADLVIVSSAVPADNPEIIEARRLGIPVLKRSEFMGRMLADSQTIAIAGTHGKTTTTAMVALVLNRSGMAPSFIAGSVIPELKANAGVGDGLYFVVEADEYDGMFLGLRPRIAVITNIELDHVDCYPCLDDMCEAFEEFIGNTVAGGTVLVCADGATALQTVQNVSRSRSDTRPMSVVSYGLHVVADWQADGLMPNQLGGTNFSVLQEGKLFGQFDTAIPGAHNVSNALAAAAVGHMVGVDPRQIADALRTFHGVARRFEIKGEAAGIVVVDDYAHHPTEIRATLQGAGERFPGRRIWAVFQPHTYSRTEALFDEFTQCFSGADHVIVTDIYAAREANKGAIGGAQLAAQIVAPQVVHMGTIDQASQYLLTYVEPGEVVITLGAGDGYMIGERVLAGLHQREELWNRSHAG